MSYVVTDNAPTRIQAEFSALQLLVHNELSKNARYDAGDAIVRHGATTIQYPCFKGERHNDGKVVFLFSSSVVVEEEDVVAWRPGTGVKDEWIVSETVRMRGFVRCEVRKPKSTNLPIDDLLRSASLTEAADYLRTAKERLDSDTPDGWNDSVSNSRNALQSAIRCKTGELHLSAGIKKLREVSEFGSAETELLDTVERLFQKSRDVLSKSGAHPPRPSRALAVLALELSTALLKFMAS